MNAKIENFNGMSVVEVNFDGDTKFNQHTKLWLTPQDASELVEMIQEALSNSEAGKVMEMLKLR
jgi:Golgi nucleoside diphosphatase